MIEFDRQLHEAGQKVGGHISVLLVQATAWWVAADLIRRHPNVLTVIETHPGDGMYDCLSVFRTDEKDPQLVVHMNLAGSITKGTSASCRLVSLQRHLWGVAGDHHNPSVQ